MNKFRREYNKKHYRDHRKKHEKKQFYSIKSKIQYFTKHQKKKSIYCSRCKRTITDINSAFYFEDENKYICFECALKEIKSRKDEIISILKQKYSMDIDDRLKLKIVYLGAGTFGLVRKLNGDRSFIIIARFQYTKPKHEKFTWTYLTEDKKIITLDEINRVE